jgi:hypothetical protein
VVAEGRRVKDDRKQNTLAPMGRLKNAIKFSMSYLKYDLHGGLSFLRKVSIY